MPAVYALLDRHEEAEAAAKKTLEVAPTFSLEGASKALPYKNPADLKLLVDAWRKAGLPDKPSVPLPDKPSIAVLPFDNLSDDPEQEYFSDGMTDDIITDLSKLKNLLVISRNSTFTFKGKEKKIPEIAKELNVRYILEGSVRRAGDQVRINAQLIDAKTDHHLWAERFDDTFRNIFKLQDKITDKIVTALVLKLSSSEEQIVDDKGTLNTAAYDAYLKGMIHKRRFTPDDYVKAISYFKQAIELDPDYSQAYAELAHTYWIPLKGGKIFWDKIGDYRTCRIRARHYLEIAMKKPTSRAYQLMARMELFKRNFDNAIDLARHAVSMSPNDADAMENLGNILVWSGSSEEAIEYYQKSIMLDPLYKSTNGIGFAYFTMGDFEKAVKYIEKALKDYPNAMSGYGGLAAAYGFLGNEMKAKAAFKKFYS